MDNGVAVTLAGIFQTHFGTSGRRLVVIQSAKFHRYKLGGYCVVIEPRGVNVSLMSSVGSHWHSSIAD